MKTPTLLVPMCVLALGSTLAAERQDSATTTPPPATAAAAASSDSAPDKKLEHRKEMRVRHLEDMPMEKVTFLGVETTQVSPTLVAQLALPSRTGLVVMHVVPESPAAAALKEHDILLKLDDQILIDQQQLSVLVRNHHEGDEVTLTYLRTGKEATVKVKLVKHDAPKLGDMFRHVPHIGALTIGHGGEMVTINEDDDREETKRVLSMIDAAHANGPVRMRFEGGDGRGMRALSINTGNSNLTYSDDDGALELSVKDGKKTLTAKNGKGEQIFSGPATTPEERKAIPAAVRERLEKLEAMHNVSFEPGAATMRMESKVFEPEGQPIHFERRHVVETGASEAF